MVMEDSQREEIDTRISICRFDLTAERVFEILERKLESINLSRIVMFSLTSQAYINAKVSSSIFL